MSITRNFEHVTTVKFDREDVEAAVASAAGRD